ncbi:MAG: hypothetical protein AAGK23_02800 [Pseudomonadota bacterium]
MPLSSIPRMREADDHRGKAPRQGPSVLLLIIIGFYIGLVAYALATQDLLAQGTKAPSQHALAAPDDLAQDASANQVNVLREADPAENTTPKLER